VKRVLTGNANGKIEEDHLEDSVIKQIGGSRMRKGKMILLTILALGIILGVVPIVHAEVPGKGDWAIGSHLSLPAIGISGKYWLTDKWCGQLTLIPSITSTQPSGDASVSASVNAYAGKLSYKLKEGKNHYFYGALSVGSLALDSTYSDASGSITISGLSLSAGFEWVIKWFALSLEIGYGWFNANAFADGDPVDLGEYETINSPMIGIGIHSYIFRK